MFSSAGEPQTVQDMFSWGEQCRRGFRLKDGKYVSSHSGDGVLFLDLGFTFTHLSAGLRALSFVKSNGNAFIIRVHESKDGTRVRGKQSESGGGQKCGLVEVCLIDLCPLQSVCSGRRRSGL